MCCNYLHLKNIITNMRGKCPDAAEIYGSFCVFRTCFQEVCNLEDAAWIFVDFVNA
jgi:hypothetical protein